jgi:signal recognition particle subunit SRP68
MLQGRYNRTKDDFEAGLIQLSVCRSILDQLAASAVSSRDQALSAVFADEIGPEIRHCAHVLGRAKAYDVDGIVAELTPKHSEKTVTGYKELIEAIKSSQSATNTASSGSRQKLEPQIWEGQPVPIRNPELVDIFLRVQDATAQLKGGSAPKPPVSDETKKGKKHHHKSRGKIAAFDAVLQTLSDAEDLARRLLESQQVSAAVLLFSYQVSWVFIFICLFYHATS